MNVLKGLIPALTALREEAGLTQEGLETRAGIGASQVSRYERGTRRPSLENLDALLAAMGKNLHDLARALDQVNGRISEAGEIREPGTIYGTGERPTARGLRAAFPAASDDLIERYLLRWNEAQGVNAALEHLEEQLALSQEKTTE